MNDSVSAVKNWKPFASIVSALVVCAHFCLLYLFATNLPFADDYDAVLNFLNLFTEANSISDKIDVLVVRHNEHRVILGKVITLIQRSVSGEVNFVALVFIGSSFLLGLVALLFTAFRSSQRSWIFFVPIPFIVFNFSSYEAFLWPMVSMQTFGVIMFAFCCFWMLAGPGKVLTWSRLSVAFFAAVVATFACGNGFLSVIIGLAGLVLKKEERKFIIVWALGSLIVLYLNFKNYAPVPGLPQPLPTLLDSPDKVVPHFFTMLGNYFHFSLPVIIACGFFILSTFLYYILPQRYSFKQPVLFFFLCFLILSCALSSLSRASFGATQALAPRYHIYSALIVACLYLMLVLEADLRKQWIKYVFSGAILAFVGIYFISLYRYSSSAKEFADALIKGAVEFNVYGSSRELAYPDNTIAEKILTESRIAKVYELPPYSLTDIQNSQQNIEPPPFTNTIQYDFSVKIKPDLIAIDSGWAFITGQAYTQGNTFVTFTSTSKNYVFNTYAMARPDVTRMLSERSIDECGFNFFIQPSVLEDGEYDLGIYVITPEAESHQKTHFKILKTGPTVTVAEKEKRRATDLDFNNNLPVWSIDKISHEANILSIEGWAIIRNIPSTEITISADLISENRIIPIKLEHVSRPDVSIVFAGEYAQSGFRIQQQVEPGKYDLRLTYKFGDTIRAFDVKKEIVIR